MEKSQTKGMKILSIILATLVGGFMWRCRGESGWGSSWGLYSVGLMLILLIYHFYGKRKGMKYELIPIGALLTGLGVTGYATVIHQMSGVLGSDLPYPMNGTTETFLPIDPYSGMAIILIMGFTLVPFFSFFVGTLFSKKEFKIQHYIIAIAIFFAVSYLVKATIAHPILKAINPDQVECAALGLKEYGFNYASPAEAYMKHFGNRGWTQDIAFFENYYMSIEHIGDLFATVAVMLYPLIAFKDKVTTGVALIINAGTSIVTTAMTSLLILPFDTGLLADVTAPRPLIGSNWGLWEFSTGAGVGFFTMLAIAILPNALTKQSEPDTAPFIDNEKFGKLINLLATVFVFGVVPMRIIGIRFGKLLGNFGVVEDGGDLGDILAIVFGVIAGIILLIAVVKNFKSGNVIAIKKTPDKFAFGLFPKYLALCAVAYFFLNHGYLITMPYGEMTSLSKAAYILTSPEQFETFVMLICLALILALYIPVRKKLKKA